MKAIGGIGPLLGFLKSKHAILRARAAEVVMTMVQNNEKSQQNIMEAGGLLALCDVFMHDTDNTAKAKSLGAISCEYPVFSKRYNQANVYWANVPTCVSIQSSHWGLCNTQCVCSFSCFEGGYSAAAVSLPALNGITLVFFAARMPVRYCL